MASSSSNPLFFLAFLSLLCFFLFFVENNPFVSAARKEHELQHTHHYVALTSLFPSPSCRSPPQGSSRKGSLEVVHKHGPCSKPKQHSTSSSSSFIIPHSEILENDEKRVRSIQSKISKKRNYDHGQEVEPKQVDISSNQSDQVQLPAKSGYLLGTGNYFVTVGLGTPKRDLSLEFDTGGDLTWTQCEPCSGSCYSQEEPIFDPSRSSSYSNISCSSPHCSHHVPATGFDSPCIASRACMYSLLYSDGSFSIGLLAKEKLTMSPTDIVDNFPFGCGENNQGHFSGTAGMLGLSRNRLSFVQQTAQKYHRIFSYCLPSFPVYVGYLNFGRPSSHTSGDIKYTPFSSIFQNSSFYGIDFIGITVAGVNIPISASSGTIIDSGTVITRLPLMAYGALREEFRRQMSRYPMVDPSGTSLDTCYNLTGYKVVPIPKISLLFAGGVDIVLDTMGIIFIASEGRVCLGFTANEDDDDVAIIGNKQQKTIEVVYDVDGERIGFRPRGCQ